MVEKTESNDEGQFSPPQNHSASSQSGNQALYFNCPHPKRVINHEPSDYFAMDPCHVVILILSYMTLSRSKERQKCRGRGNVTVENRSADAAITTNLAKLSSTAAPNASFIYVTKTKKHLWLSFFHFTVLTDQTNMPQSSAQTTERRHHKDNV